MQGNLNRRVRRLESELRIWRLAALALAMVFLGGAALENRTQPKELRPKEIKLVRDDGGYAAVLRPDGLRLFAGDKKLLGSITSRDEGEFGVTAELELSDPRASTVKLATYGLTLATGSEKTTVTSSGLRVFVFGHGADRSGRVSNRVVQRHS
jgi:hypothetical protein